SSDLTHTHTHTPISYWHSDQRLVMEGKCKWVVCDMNSRESSSYPSPPLWILKPHVMDELVYKSVTPGNVSLSLCVSLSLVAPPPPLGSASPCFRQSWAFLIRSMKEGARVNAEVPGVWK